MVVHHYLPADAISSASSLGGECSGGGGLEDGPWCSPRSRFGFSLFLPMVLSFVCENVSCHSSDCSSFLH